MKKICIVGGGTSGWFTAAFFAKKLGPNIDITLVESTDIPTIGVGESVTPHVVDFITDKLEIDEKEWMRETGAIFKLANKFVDWEYPGHTEYFSFTYALPESFALEDKFPKELEDFIPASDEGLTTDHFLSLYKQKKLKKFDKFFNPQYHWMDSKKFHVGYLNVPYGTSHHINADLTSEFVKNKVALPLGVKHIRSTVQHVLTEHGSIKKIKLETGQELSADFFIDCTGFKRLLISHLTSETKLYNYPIDRAVVGRTEYTSPNKEMANYTQSIAQDWGWIFRVTLANRIGNGFCYSGSYCSDQYAFDFFKKQFNIEPKQIKWTPERLIEPCKGNVVCVGLSNGFIEPLEANNLYIIIKSVNLAYEFVKEALENKNYNHSYFNDKIGFALDDIHDFLLVHYTLCNNKRSKLWQDMYEKGITEKHIDLVYSKFKDPKNNMISAFKGETLFPDYMWLQLACSWNLDLSKWTPSKCKYDSNIAEIYFNNIHASNLVKSKKAENFNVGYNKWINNQENPC